MELQSQDKESTPSSLGIAPSWISTEVYYTTEIGPKPTKEKLKLMGNA